MTRPLAAALLALALAVPARAHDDDRDGDRKPRILSVDSDAEHVFVNGTGFGVGKAPTVLLGTSALAVDTYSPTTIVARLPSPARYFLPALPFAAFAAFTGLRSFERAFGGPSAGKPTSRGFSAS